MVYPRRCLLCETDYPTGPAVADGFTTVRADPGGTPDPRHPEWPGRRLLLRCSACRGQYLWDYFGDAGRPVTAVQAMMRLRGAHER